jgi:isocitrate dehydrogenase
VAKKINVKDTSLVVMHGDEMAQVAFEQIIKQFITKYVDINLEEVDLSAENRIRTNGKVVLEAIEKLEEYRVGVKNAGITVNKAQLGALLQKLHGEGNRDITEATLNKLATKSPNGTIRKGIHGNITREDIPFNNIAMVIPEWKGRDIEVVTMDEGGLKNSFNMVAQKRGQLSISFTNNDGVTKEIHSRLIKKKGVFLFATHDIASVKLWARNFFNKALKEKKDAYVGLKDTVIPGYDGVMRHSVDDVFNQEFATEFEKVGIKYEYGLIDAQAAYMIVNPPEKALWGIPDNTSGRKMYKLVNTLKKYGMPNRPVQRSISRMSAGGGDQYGSFNMAAPEDGMITVSIGETILHERELLKGDPMLLMSNECDPIRDWVRQCFSEASKKDQELYFGLKREYMPYDEKFAEIITEVRKELSVHGNTPPPIMIMTPSKQIRKMIVDPPRNARYASLNLDGDIFSDITAALGGSLATASSVIMSSTGTMLFEAPHGTAPDLYSKYIESKGKDVFFNPSALLYAFANALEVIAERSHKQELLGYARAIKQALIETVDSGIITGDLAGKTTNKKTEKIVDMPEFLNAVESNMKKYLG